MHTLRRPHATPFGGAVLLAILNLGGCQRQEAEPTPPYRAVYESFDVPGCLLKEFAENETRANQAYKGRVLRIGRVGSNLWKKELRVDADGQKYLFVHFTFPFPWLKKCKVIRCYLYRPDDPIVEKECPEEEAQACGVKGIYRGIEGDAMILDNCTLFLQFVEGADW